MEAQLYCQFYSTRVDPTYFLGESILTETLHDTPTFEVPSFHTFEVPSYYTFLALQIIIDAILSQHSFNPNRNFNENQPIYGNSTLLNIDISNYSSKQNLY